MGGGVSCTLLFAASHLPASGRSSLFALRLSPEGLGLAIAKSEKRARGEERIAVPMSKTALVAVGGNSLIRAGEKGTIAEQLANTRRTAEAIVGLVRLGYRLVITHGNGPQVGAQLLRSERASDVVYSQTLDVCGACSQGEIGYLLAQSLENELAAAGMDVPVASLVTQTVVSADDPAMQHPTKPIGPFYSRADAEEKKRIAGLADRRRCGARLSPRRALARSRRDSGAGRHPVADQSGCARRLYRRRRDSGDAGERPAARRGSGDRQGPRFCVCWPRNLAWTCSRSRRIRNTFT